MRRKPVVFGIVIGIVALAVASGSVAADGVPEVTIDDAPSEVAPGDTFTITYTLTNVGEEPGPEPHIVSDPGALPQGVTLESINPVDPAFEPNLDNGRVDFEIDFDQKEGLLHGESVTAEYTYSVDETASDSVTISAEGATHLDRDSVETTIDVTGDGGPPDQALQAIAGGDGEIGFQDVLGAITAFNNGQPVDGVTIGFQEVLSAISTFNQGGQV